MEVKPALAARAKDFTCHCFNMFQSFFTFLGRLYSLILSIILSVVMGIVVWAIWELYREEKLSNQFGREGQLVSVKIEDTSTKQHSWQDYLGNVLYLTFQYKNQIYTARFVTDTLYVSTGDRVSLLYHPGIDAFRQPGGQLLHFNQSQGSSRLIKWSVVGTFSEENRWLMLCLVFSAFFFMFASGTLVTITNWNFLTVIGRFVFVVFLMAATLFFTYDVWEYYQYHQHIKANGREMEVKIMDTDQRSYSSRQSRSWKWYFYTATVRFQGQERVIPLKEADYEELKPGDQFLVLYDKTLDDMMPVGYPVDYRQFFVVCFFWLISAIVIWHMVIRPKRTSTPSHREEQV